MEKFFDDILENIFDEQDTILAAEARLPTQAGTARAEYTVSPENSRETPHPSERPGSDELTARTLARHL